MKLIPVLLFMLLFSSCSNSNNKTDSLQPAGDESSSPAAAPEPDSLCISVVRPLEAPRIITVGGRDSDIGGFTSEAIQAAVDAVRTSGEGGRIKLAPGIYDITAPVRLYSNMTLEGSGPKTVLRKCRGYSSPFSIDADYGELRITVEDASGFRKGMGVAVYDETQRYGWDLTTARITAIEGNTVFIDEYLLRDYHADKKGTLSNACSVVEAFEAENVIIRNLFIDGNGDTNDKIDGCRAGGVYLHKVRNALVESITVRDFNSDGISWQLTEYVTVRNCEIYGCKSSGLHPGTGSPFTIIEGNSSHDNGGYGLFVCWRVRNGEVRNNKFFHNGRNGISTGHKDTDMLYSGNHIYENGLDGIHLRGEKDLNAPHRSIFRENIVENNGMKEESYGISVNSKAEDVVLERNIFRSTGKGNQAAAVLLMKNSLPVLMRDNTMAGHPEGEIVKEK